MPLGGRASFSEEYSHSPSPESFLAAASQRTKTSGLATAFSSHHQSSRARRRTRRGCSIPPANGRCEFGNGESASITELTPFGRDMETKKEVFERRSAPFFPRFKEGGTPSITAIFRYSLAQCCAETGAEAASAIVDGGSQLPTIERAGQNALGHSASSSSAQMRASPGARLLQAMTKR